MLEAGAVLGGYRIERELGRGGMGAVLLARDAAGAPVAIKLLLLTDERARQRFQREAALGRTLEHPNVVRVRDAGESPQGCYLVMEYVEGRTLTQVLRERGRLPGPLLGTILGQLVDGLEVLHARGLVHRDLKPDNLMVTREGVVKIMDLGLVHVPDVTALTRTGSVVGTPWFLAPEQLRDARGVGPQADLFSTAVLLYFAMTGKHPFGADRNPDLVEYFKGLLHGVTRPWYRSRRGGPLDLFFRRALHVDPDQRFADARALLQGFEAAVAGEQAAGLSVDATLELPEAAEDEDDSTRVSGPHRPQDTPADSAGSPGLAPAPAPPPSPQGGRRPLLLGLAAAAMALGFLWQATAPEPALVTEVRGLRGPAGYLLSVRTDRPTRLRLAGATTRVRRQEGRWTVLGFPSLPEVLALQDARGRPLFGKRAADVEWSAPAVLRHRYLAAGGATLEMADPGWGRVLLRRPGGAGVAVMPRPQGVHGFRLEAADLGGPGLWVGLDIEGEAVPWGEVAPPEPAAAALDRCLARLEALDVLELMAGAGRGPGASRTLRRRLDEVGLTAAVLEVQELLPPLAGGPRCLDFSKLMVLDAALEADGTPSPFAPLVQAMGTRLWQHGFFAGRPAPGEHRVVFPEDRDIWALAEHDLTESQKQTIGLYIPPLPEQRLAAPDRGGPIWLELFTHRWGQGAFAALEVNGAGPFFLSEDPRIDLEAAFAQEPRPPESDHERRVYRLRLPEGVVRPENRVRLRFFLWWHEVIPAPAVIVQAIGLAQAP